MPENVSKKNPRRSWRRTPGVRLAAFLAATTLLGSPLRASWEYGIGTGIYFLTIDGDFGLTTLLGPVVVPVELNPDDVFDYAESMFGLEAYATDGDWWIHGSFVYLDLQGSGTAEPVFLDVGFATFRTEAVAGYPVYKAFDDKLVLRAYGGLRYTAQDVDFGIGTTGPPAILRTRTVTESWTNFLLGTQADWQIAERWSCYGRADIGIGQATGSWYTEVGINWRVLQHLSTGIYGSFLHQSYETGSLGAPNYYLYEADEYGGGVRVTLVL